MGWFARLLSQDAATLRRRLDELENRLETVELRSQVQRAETLATVDKLVSKLQGRYAARAKRLEREEQTEEAETSGNGDPPPSRSRADVPSSAHLARRFRGW